MPMPMLRDIAPRALESILARERRWATRHGLALDVSGDHLSDADDALCVPLGEDERERLGRHPDRPLGEVGKPAAVSRLGSAWGIACNLIAVVGPDAIGGLLSSVGAPGEPVRRGWVHPSDSLDAGTPPTPLVRIDRGGDRPVFIEIRGAELAHGASACAHVLPDPPTGWGDLEGCRQLAAQATRGEGVPSARMLRRIRSLCRTLGRRGFRYVVVRPQFDAHFDDALRRHFDGIRMRIGGEVDFDAVDLATLHTRLARCAESPHPALGWLAERYLDTPAR